jgi:hypothetical protein
VPPPIFQFWPIRPWQALAAPATLFAGGSLMSRSVRRIATWSGPRNISTAMMRAWGNRADTFVCDEPLYAHYLLETRAPHPCIDEVIAHHETDWRKVVAWLTGPVPEGKAIFYQKHMTHHLLPEIERGWMLRVDNVFLIREPREVITSLALVTPNPNLADTGYPQQDEIFDWLREQTGKTPLVVDARDVLEDPGRSLRRLCEALDVEFTEAMLSWPAGPRDTDGVWGKHWYEAVWQTTSFQPYKPKHRPVPPHLTGLLDEADRLYQRLCAHRIV